MTGRARLLARTFTAPAAWASYLLNGEANDADAVRAADAWLASIAPYEPVDVARDDDESPLPADEHGAIEYECADMADELELPR
jgi:hypothetical protein